MNSGILIITIVIGNIIDEGCVTDNVNENIRFISFVGHNEERR